MADSYYAVLGVDSSASTEDIRKAFKRNALALHPDKGGTKAKFQEVVAAFEILIDTHSRSEYDRRLPTVGLSSSRPSPPKRQRMDNSPPVMVKRPKEKDNESRIRYKESKEGSFSGSVNSKAKSLRSSRRTTKGVKPLGRSKHPIEKMVGLLQQLRPDKRRTVISCKFSEAQRLALEKWMITKRVEHRKEHYLNTLTSSQPLNMPALCRHTNLDGAKRTSSSITKKSPTHITSTLCTLPRARRGRTQIRGISSEVKKGRTLYSALICVGTITLVTRKVRHLKMAVDYLVVLMDIKRRVLDTMAAEVLQQKSSDTIQSLVDNHEGNQACKQAEGQMGSKSSARAEKSFLHHVDNQDSGSSPPYARNFNGSDDASLFESTFRQAVRVTLMEYGLDAEMDLGLRFIISVSAKRWIGTVLRTPWFRTCDLDRGLRAWRCFSDTCEQLRAGHKYFAVPSPEELWRRVRNAFLSFLDEIGTRPQIAAKLDALEEAHRPKRQLERERWNRCAMAREDRRQQVERHCEQREVRAMARADASSRKVAQQDTLRQMRASCLEERAERRIDLWLGRWRRLEEREAKVQERRLLMDKRRNQEAREQLKRADARNRLRVHKQHKSERNAWWRWLHQRDLTMDELRKGWRPSCYGDGRIRET